MKTSTRIRTIALPLGLGAATVAGLVAAPAMASAETMPTPAQQQAPPANPVNHPWQLRTQVDHYLDGWTVEVNGKAIQDVKSVDSYSGPLATGRIDLDYRSWGQHPQAEWTVDFFDAGHARQGRLLMTMTESGGQATYRFSRIAAPEWMETSSLRDYYGDQDGIMIQA